MARYVILIPHWMSTLQTWPLPFAPTQMRTESERGHTAWRRRSAHIGHWQSGAGDAEVGEDDVLPGRG